MFDDLDEGAGIDACISPEAGQPHASKHSQVEGLIRCLDETNELIRGFHEALMMKPMRDKLSMDLQLARNKLQSFEDKQNIELPSCLIRSWRFAPPFPATQCP